MINDNLFKGYNVGVSGDNLSVTQDIAPHLAWAKSLREANRTHNRYSKRTDTGFKPYCNVPDSVALDIMTKFNLNLHDPNIQPEDLKKIKRIIKTTYPHLMYY
jgi:hypothetical protein